MVFPVKRESILLLTPLICFLTFGVSRHVSHPYVSTWVWSRCTQTATLYNLSFMSISWREYLNMHRYSYRPVTRMVVLSWCNICCGCRRFMWWPENISCRSRFKYPPMRIWLSVGEVEGSGVGVRGMWNRHSDGCYTYVVTLYIGLVVVDIMVVVPSSVWVSFSSVSR